MSINIGPLDSRAKPNEIYLGTDCIIFDTLNIRNLDYYGGFGYVSSEHRTTLGDYIIFSTADERVSQVHDAYQLD